MLKLALMHTIQWLGRRRTRIARIHRLLKVCSHITKPLEEGLNHLTSFPAQNYTDFTARTAKLNIKGKRHPLQGGGYCALENRPA